MNGYNPMWTEKMDPKTQKMNESKNWKTKFFY